MLIEQQLKLVRIAYRKVRVDGIDIFYRKAGPEDAPTIVLLHGFPSSSHMYRDLIPLLAQRYQVVAPDMPGFGYSDQPAAREFEYTFAHLTDIMDSALDALGVTRFSMYVQDYGSVIGFRLFAKKPDRIESIIVQNGNAYADGLSTFWAEWIEPFWKERNAATEQKIAELLAFATTRFQYAQGFRNPEAVNPDSYYFDQMTLDRPGNREIQLALFYDYQNNLTQYPAWQEALRTAKPPLLAVWGKNDPILLPAAAEAFRRDVPDAEIHFLDTGHFALEEDLGPIASLVEDFLGRHVARK